MDGGSVALVDPTRQRRFEVKARLRDAAVTLHCLPMPRDLARLSRLGAAWPHVPPDFWASYGRERVRGRPPAATPEQLARLDQVLGWLLALEADQRRLVGLWMFGLDCAEIAERLRVSRGTVWNRLNAALDRLSDRLQQ